MTTHDTQPLQNKAAPAQRTPADADGPPGRGRLLDRTTARMLVGIVLVIVMAGALGLICAMVVPSEADIDRAAAALEQERRPPEQRDPDYAWPDLSRWDFVTHLPVPGQVNQYRWRAQGGFACSLDADRDRMVNFRLDTPNADDPITLVSPLAVFDKKTRTLETEAATNVTFSWGTARSARMNLDLETTNATFDQDVVVEVLERGTAGLLSTTNADAEDGASGNEAENGANGDAPDEPLTITAEHFEIVSAEDKGIFTGDVVAIDGKVTIWADKMIVEYYSDEEKQQDPERTGMKRITCLGHVIIDQETEQALCDKAVYDLETETITLEKSETEQVLYRKDDANDHYQILADRVVFDRKPDGKTVFSGHTKAVDFSESREDFLKLRTDEEPDADTDTDTGNDEHGDESGNTDTQ